MSYPLNQRVGYYATRLNMREAFLDTMRFLYPSGVVIGSEQHRYSVRMFFAGWTLALLSKPGNEEEVKRLKEEHKILFTEAPGWENYWRW